MSENLDHLSIEELQSQLVQIQRRIQEKEKLQVIEKITDLLKLREPEFVHTVLDLVEGQKNLRPVEKTPEKTPVALEEKPKKEGAYLRNGKIFFGIQEIKFTKFDKNQVLRISKEGKGLPPRVDAFPDEIRNALLTLPVRSEATPPSPSEIETVVDDRIPPLSPESESEPIAEVEPDPVAQVVEPPTVFLEVAMDADQDETQVLPDPEPAPDKPPTPRSSRKSEAEPKPAKTVAPPKIKPEPLQASLF